jgi:hypothetical protein
MFVVVKHSLQNLLLTFPLISNKHKRHPVSYAFKETFFILFCFGLMQKTMQAYLFYRDGGHYRLPN